MYRLALDAVLAGDAARARRLTDAQTAREPLDGCFAIQQRQICVQAPVTSACFFVCSKIDNRGGDLLRFAAAACI